MNKLKIRPRARFPGRLDPAQVRHAFKTGLAAVLTLLLCTALDLKQGYWAVISAVIVMQANLGGSLAAGWSRVLGTGVGAVLGTASLYLFGSSPLSLGAALFTTILICAYMTFLHDSFRLAGITAAIVILMAPGSSGYFVLGLERFIEISLGVGAAMLVSFLVLPSRAGVGLRKGLARGQEELAALYERVVFGGLDGKRDEPGIERARNDFFKTRDRNRKLLAEAGREPLGLRRRNQILVSLVHFQDRLYEDIHSLDLAGKGFKPGGLQTWMEGEFRLLAKAASRGMRALGNGLLSNREGLDGVELVLALKEAEKGLLAMRKAKASAQYELDQAVHFFAFYFSLKEAAAEVAVMLPRLGRSNG